MNSVFVSGSISINKLPSEVIKSFDKIIAQNIHVFVGDADGVDTLTQKYFASQKYTNVSVCTVYDKPRNILSNFFTILRVPCEQNIKSEREKQTVKDSYMTNHTNYSFVIWDGKSKGSFANIKRAIENNKKIKVYCLDLGRFLKKEELNIAFIEDIFKSNTGYTSNEILEKIKDLNIYTGISKASELRKWLINHKILKQSQDKIEINSNYKSYFIVQTYKGNQIIKYKKDLLKLISKNSLFSKEG